MKSEKQIIDELGEWLCRDMEKDLEKNRHQPRLITIAEYEKLQLIADVARRIRWYRDNVA